MLEQDFDTSTRLVDHRDAHELISNTDRGGLSLVDAEQVHPEPSFATHVFAPQYRQYVSLHGAELDNAWPKIYEPCIGWAQCSAPAPSTSVDMMVSGVPQTWEMAI